MAGYCFPFTRTTLIGTKRAKEILKRTGAQDISSTGGAESDDASDGRNSKLFRKGSRS
jgi:hypothetical protein